MNMKIHILAALREKFDDWEALLASLSKAELTDPRFPGNWSVKDILAHLWAWQQRSVARIEAAQQNREPQFPQWAKDIDPEAEDVDQLNDWIYNSNRGLPWATVYQNWRTNFLRLLELAEAIPEMKLLDDSGFAWMGGYSLSDVLVGTYDHHQEHYEKLLAWLHMDNAQLQTKSTAPQPNPALLKLGPFIGEWQTVARANGEVIGQGQTIFEWLENGAFLVQRSNAEAPFPSATAIIAADETTGAYHQSYFDSRVVVRLYQMSFSENVWKLWRDAPGFPQRFSGTFSADGKTITGAWEKSDDGSNWEKDFDLIYTKVK